MIRQMGLEPDRTSLERNQRLQDAIRGGPPRAD
jgi:hypothetical protein